MHRLDRRHQFRACVNCHHAGCLLSFANTYRLNQRIGVRRSDEYDMRQSRQSDVIYVHCLTFEKSPCIRTRKALPDIGLF